MGKKKWLMYYGADLAEAFEVKVAKSVRPVVPRSSRGALLIRERCG